MRFRRINSQKRRGEHRRFSFLKAWASYFAIYGALMAIAGIIGFFYVKARVQVLEIGYQIAEAEKRYQELKLENERLHFEVIFLRSPERIVSLAEQKLALSFPTPQQIFLLTGE